MRLPAQIEYAYKAIIELAIRYKGDSPVQLSVISESQEIPKKYLTQLLLRLKNANIVDSIRGLSGGYHLTRPPSQISLADVIRAIDDTVIEAPREVKGQKTTEADRILSRIWADVAKDAAKRFEKITFDKLISQMNSDQFAYSI